MAPGAVHVVSVLSLLCVSWRPALCLVSDECEHYYDYYVPQLTHSTRCSGSTGTGCMSLMCDNPRPQRTDDCTKVRTRNRCWLACKAPRMIDKDTAALLCGRNHARLPVIDSDDARMGLQEVLTQSQVSEAWVDGGPNNSTPPVSDNWSDWTYSNGTVIPDRFWAHTEPHGIEEACIRWNKNARKKWIWRKGNGAMEDYECDEPMWTKRLICECGNEKSYPLGALTKSQCIEGQPKGKSTMAQECWRIATQMVNDAVSNNAWTSTSLDHCQCAWCTENCDMPTKWTSEWRNETITDTPIPTVANDHTKFTRKKRTHQYSHNKKEALLTAMIILSSVSLLFAVLCATLVTLSAVRHWQHKQRLAKAIHNAGRNRKEDEM